MLSTIDKLFLHIGDPSPLLEYHVLFEWPITHLAHLSLPVDIFNTEAKQASGQTKSPRLTCNNKKLKLKKERQKTLFCIHNQYELYNIRRARLKMIQF